jgi:hypothetical protein
MDVTLNTNYLNIANTSQNPAKTSSNAADTAINNIEYKFNYSDVMMGLEELQNFLFMLIGAEIPGKNSETDKGNKLNLLA